MGKHKYLNYAQIVKEHPKHFELRLSFNPQPAQKQETAETGIDASQNTVLMTLPTPLCLMLVSQLQMLNTQGFSTLSVEAFIKQGKHQKLQIHTGTSYLEHLYPEELQRIDSWFARVCCHITQQHL
ncbi:MAG: hypothetical protein AAGI45_13325 [Cyanobacteria bacterium P01_H01_bin.26]